MSMRFGDCASCLFIESKSVSIARAYHGIPWGSGSEAHIFDPEPPFTRTAIPGGAVSEPFQATPSMPPYPAFRPNGSFDPGLLTSGTGLFLRVETASGIYSTYNCNPLTGEITPFFNPGANPGFLQLHGINFSQPNTNHFEELVVEFESIDLSTMPWGRHYDIRYSGGSRTQAITNDPTPAPSRTLIAQTDLRASHPIGNATILRKFAVRTNGMICLGMRVSPATGFTTPVVIRDFAQSHGITELTVDRPRDQWGYIEAYIRDAQSCGIDSTVPALCYPSLS